ncbi:unnamed protein product [Acanthoscelides obtectus]|uniref:Uncharacterized protein n=1 Tax=Acanthoscelides obtectus TaxID=200917 RepID=A0A9P0PRX4_ACAOB|nr:unnamed protein product [Acanthoscelides obtectus]CAK1641993.1 hypothetical protein AOBTE_LOCUS12779 [Acanthoscelides obtectus]
MTAFISETCSISCPYSDGCCV